MVTYLRELTLPPSRSSMGSLHDVGHFNRAGGHHRPHTRQTGPGTQRELRIWGHRQRHVIWTFQDASAGMAR